MENLGKVFYSILLITISSLIGGYTFHVLWKWFIIPPFGAPELSIVQSIGIINFISFVWYKNESKNKEKEEDFTKKLTGKFIYLLGLNLAMLGIGWIITLFL